MEEINGNYVWDYYEKKIVDKANQAKHPEPKHGSPFYYVKFCDKLNKNVAISMNRKLSNEGVYVEQCLIDYVQSFRVP